MEGQRVEHEATVNFYTLKSINTFDVTLGIVLLGSFQNPSLFLQCYTGLPRVNAPYQKFTIH